MTNDGGQFYDQFSKDKTNLLMFVRPLSHLGNSSESEQILKIFFSCCEGMSNWKCYTYDKQNRCNGYGDMVKKVVKIGRFRGGFFL